MKLNDRNEKALRKALWESGKGCTCEPSRDGKAVPREDRCSTKVMRCNGRHAAWLEALDAHGLKHPLARDEGAHCGVKLTANDVETLRAIAITLEVGDYDGYVPHTQAERVGARRLVTFGLATDLGPCACRDCDNPRHWESGVQSSYALTEDGRRALAKVPR